MTTYFDQAKTTYMENWTPELRAMSIPFASVEMTRSEMIAMGLSARNEDSDLFEKYATEAPPGDHRGSSIRDVVKRAYAALGCPDDAPVFVRLGSRSPKDSYRSLLRRYRCDSPDQVVETMLDSEERVTDDLLWALNAGYRSHLVLRPWVDIVIGSEARCFVRDGRCVAVSEYDYRQRDVSKTALANKDVVEEYRRYAGIAETAAAAAGMTNLVVDLGVVGDGPVVIEVNPYFELTDPCLFKWDHLASIEATEIRLFDRSSPFKWRPLP
jgi:hypothetical protein